MTHSRHWLRPLTAAGLVLAAFAWLVVRPLLDAPSTPDAPSAEDLAEPLGKLNEVFARQWQDNGIESAAAADDLTGLRRISLALVGSVPSIEEIREFENDSSGNRLQRWTSRFIADRRFIEYFGVNLSEAFIDLEGDNQEAHQRLRFIEWIGESIQKGRPYDEMAREIIAGRGVLADEPAATMVAMEFGEGVMAPERLAGRISRALLGQRIDCAQCHDHPFDDWTQGQFEGIAAHFGQVNVRMAMIQDTRRGPFVIDDTRNNLKREVEPAVPFDPEWRPEDGNQRERLATWVTHPENRRFRRAIANRMWGLLVGRPLVHPVDGLPDPPDANEPDALDILGNDFAAHDHDLRRMIHLIVASRPFGLESTHPGLDDAATAQTLQEAHAVFPLSELDAHQLIRSMQQAVSIRTIRPEAEWTYVRLKRYESRFQFVRDYGEQSDDSENEASTVPQAAERLTGYKVRNLTRPGVTNAPGRIGAMAAADKGVEEAFLACLTRRPAAEEAAFFLDQPGRNTNQRSRTVEDVYWTLFNSAEFCWNH